MKKPMKLFLLSIIACQMGTAVLAQNAPADRDFMDRVFKSSSKGEAVYYRDLTPTAEGFSGSVYWINGDLRMTGFYKEDNEGGLVKHGDFIFYYDNGNIESLGSYEYDIKVGAWKRFTTEGTARPNRYYKPDSADFIRDAMAGK
jgi:antitoxin component YwqK of YwqJK toxin-antitoxin module